MSRCQRGRFRALLRMAVPLRRGRHCQVQQSSIGATESSVHLPSGSTSGETMRYIESWGHRIHNGRSKRWRYRFT